MNKKKSSSKLIGILDSNFEPLIYLKPIDYIISFKEVPEVINKINLTKTKLCDFTEIWQGLIAYGQKNQERIYTSNFKETEFHRKLLYGGDIGKYSIKFKGEYLKYGNWLHRPRPSYIYDKPKILVQRIRNPKIKTRLVCTIDSEKYINGTGLSNILLNNDVKFSLSYILGIINSKLINYWFAFYYNDVNIKPEQLRKIPFFYNDVEQISAKVDQILSLKKDNPAADTSDLEREIDLMVYELYGLSKEDIEIVENS